MEYKIEDFTNEKMGIICSWFQHIVDMASKLTTGNITHQGATIRNYARSYIQYIADFYIDDDWHPYDKQNHSTAPSNNEIVLTHLETGGVVAQRYNECYGRFDINNLVDKYKYVRLKL